MANSMYSKGRELFLEAGCNALTDTVKVSLVSTSYTPNLATDQFYNIISGGAIVAAGVALSSRSGAAGTLSAGNILFTSVSGSTASYIPLYKDTGTSSTSPLLGLIDTGTGLPVTPNGGDITVAWAGGQIFTLFEGLPETEKSRMRQFLEWLRDACGIPAVLSPAGRIWIPKPQIIQAA